MADKTKDLQPQTQDGDTETPEPQADNLPENQVNVEDAGTLKKKLTVTIHTERIDAKRDEMFGELSNTAQVPGFRIGRAPRRLLEKRFGKEVAQDVRNALIAESISDALEKSELKTIGEPDLDLEKIELPEEGNLEFNFEVEVKPEFDLPDLKGIQIEKTLTEITDERIDQEIDLWVHSQARFEDTQKPAEEGDMIVGAAKIRIAGIDEPFTKPGLTLRVSPGQIEGIPLVDLGEALAGKAPEQTAEINTTVPDAHPNAEWRGKEASIEIHISQVRHRILPEINDDLAKGAGFDSLDELRQYVRNRAQMRLDQEIQRNMREQVQKYLLDNVEFDLPAGLVQSHASRLFQRRTVELLQQGVSREQIDENLTKLQAAVQDQTLIDLKLQFILYEIAEQREIAVTADEVNARVAQMAGMYNRRPERLRQELAADGTLTQLETVIQEEKAIDSLLKDAKIVEAKPEKQEKPEKKPKKKAEKKTKKTTKKSVKKTVKKSAKKTAKKTKKQDK